jgi:hypothetical protein
VWSGGRRRFANQIQVKWHLTEVGPTFYIWPTGTLSVHSSGRSTSGETRYACYLDLVRVSFPIQSACSAYLSPGPIHEGGNTNFSDDGRNRFDGCWNRTCPGRERNLNEVTDATLKRHVVAGQLQGLAVQQAGSDAPSIETVTVTKKECRSRCRERSPTNEETTAVRGGQC